MKKNFLGSIMIMAVLFGAVCSGAFAGPREVVVNYAYDIYNFTWTADESILLHNMGGKTIPAGSTIRGIPYTLYGTGDSFETYKQLIEDNKKGINNDLYERATYTIWTGATRTSMKRGMACAMFVTNCIRQGFLPSVQLSLQPAVEFHGEYR